MYTPSYLVWLDRRPARPDGYPAFLTDQDIQWLEAQVVHFLKQCEERTYNPQLHNVTDYWSNDAGRPQNLRLLGWDALHGITHRALLSVAEARWKLRKRSVQTTQ